MSAKVRWVGGVIGLLVANAVAVAVLLGAAGGDTRRRVVPDYYQRAAAWDDVMAEEAASARLGWRCDSAVGGRELDLRCRDAAGAPLTGATVDTRVVPRGRLDEASQVRLVDAGGGHYRASLPGPRHGLHDLVLTVVRGPDRWTAARLVELAPARRAAP